MKAVYIPVGATGHILASLPMIGELVKKGVEVSYFAPEQYRGQVEKVNAKFIPIPDAVEGESVDAGDDFLAGIPLVFLGMALGAIDTVMANLEKDRPDVIIADSLALAGRLAASKLNIPLITMFTSYAANEHFSICRAWPVYPDTNPARAKALEIARGLQAQYGGKLLDVYEIFEGKSEFNIVTLTKSFQPAGETFGDDFFFAGAQIAPRDGDGSWEAPNNGKPLLYTSLGSLFNNWPEFYTMLFEAVKGLDINVLCSLGKVLKPEDLGEIPENVTTMPFTPQLEVLSKTDYFITHAGVGSVMEALYFGVPCLSVPQMDEQIFTAKRMEEVKVSSCSLFPREKVTAEGLRAGLLELINNPAYSRSAKGMAEEMRTKGGCERAAQAVIDYMANRK